jgi:hypothetical protein
VLGYLLAGELASLAGFDTAIVGLISLMELSLA